MKKITTLITLLLCAASLFAQVPENFTYQAVVRNASNALVANAQVGVRVNILQGTASGNAVYSESHVTTTNTNGLVTVNIGGGSVLHGSFTGIDWSDGPYFLKTDIDPNGGNDYSITSVQQLLSVPYALYAKEAGNVPTVPTNVSAFTNDAGYITAQEIPTIPTIPTNVSAFTNDAGYLTSYTETDPQFNAWDKDYNDLINKPAIPNVPTNVSAFANDAGYITTYIETDPQYNAWDKDYNDLINKPTIPTVPTNVSAFTNDAGYITQAQVPVQVNADWSATTGAALILNKPNLFSGDYNDLINKPVLFSGNYNDLTNKPTLFDGNYNSLTNRPNLAAVALSGSYNDLINKPAIPTAVGELTNNVGYITAAQVPTQVNADWNATSGAAQIFNKPTLFSGDYNDLTNKPVIPTVPTNVSAFNNDAGYITEDDLPDIPTVPTNVSAFTNDAGYLTSYTETDPQFNAWDKDYNDLTNKPTIPTVPTNVSDFSNDAGYLSSYTETDPEFNAWDKDYNDLTNKPTLFSGDYNDLTNKPTIPTVNNATLTIQKNGSNVGTFTANQNTNQTVNITVPTTTSQLTNNSGFITSADLPAVPTNMSQLNNDAGYITAAQCGDVDICAMANQLAQLQQQMAQMQARLDSLEGNTFTCGTSTVTDHEGNVYNTVQIGDQCWTKENLRTTTSPSTGTYLIPAAGTGYTYTGKQARWYNNDSATYAPMNYGLLYNWNAAVDTFNTAYGETSVNTSNAVSVTFTGHRRGICPAGWHLPSDAEWTQLTNYVSSQSEYTCDSNSNYIAKALASTEGWNSYSGECYPGDQSVTANNATGFSAVPAGLWAGSSFSNAGYHAYFWSATQYASSTFYAYYRNLYYNRAYVVRSNPYKFRGYSVRCLRDDVSGVGGSGSSAVIDEKSCPAAPTVTDHEGNVYATVQIGNQCWMRDNLRTTTSPSTGTYLIPAANANYTYTGKQAFWYNNDSATYAPMNYGLLYNWNAAVDTFNTSYGETSTSSGNAVSVTFSGHRRGICPVGWHLPSDAEWTAMTDYVSSQSEYVCGGNTSYIAKALADSVGWNSSTYTCVVGNNQSANNATGFSAVPAGYCLGSSFGYAGYGAYFWSSSQDEYDPDYAWERSLYYISAYVGRNGNYKNYGYSVRCLRD